MTKTTEARRTAEAAYAACNSAANLAALKIAAEAEMDEVLARFDARNATEPVAEEVDVRDIKKGDTIVRFGRKEVVTRVYVNEAHTKPRFRFETIDPRNGLAVDGRYAIDADYTSVDIVGFSTVNGKLVTKEREVKHTDLIRTRNPFDKITVIRQR
jgi:hypothetical protein